MKEEASHERKSQVNASKGHTKQEIPTMDEINQSEGCSSILTPEQLLTFFGPYDRMQPDLHQELMQRSQLSHETQRATVATAINLIEAARSVPTVFSLRQVFYRYPIQSAEGQTLFQLITQLCHITDKTAQQIFIQQCFACAGWMKETKRRDQFFSTTSTWGLSLANRFFTNVSDELTPAKDSISQRFARRFGSPIMHKTIMQAIARLTDPLIYATNFEEAVRKSKLTPLHLRPSLPYALTLQVGQQNQQAYLDLMNAVASYYNPRPQDTKSSIHVELHHFTGPFDVRQASRVKNLITMLIPMVKAAQSNQITLILHATQPFSNPLLRTLFEALFQYSIVENTKVCVLGLELSSAEPSSLDCLAWLQALAGTHSIRIPIRMTKERTKPSLDTTAAIHAAYISMAQFCLRRDSCLNPWFVTHNAYTVACVHHMAKELHNSHFEMHHRCGVDHRSQTTFETLHQGITRLEAPLGEKNQHHHMILQRLREITDPNAFLNRLYDENTTTAGLVNHPSQQMKRHTPKNIDFWRRQKVKPHQTNISVLDSHIKTREMSAKEAELCLDKRPFTISHSDNQQLEKRWEQLKKAHTHTINCASLLVKLFVDHMDIPRHISELQVEAALRQQERFLQKPFKHINATARRFPKGTVLFIGSSQRPLSPLLEQITRALLLGNRIYIKPASATLTLIEQILQSFWLAGFNPEDCVCLPLSHESLQSLLATTQIVDTVIFDGLQQHAKTLSGLTLNNSKQPPIPFWTTPASSCVSTQGMCLIDETASDQELYMLAADAWKMGPMIVLATQSMAPKLQDAFLKWRESLVIGDADNRDTHLSLTQALQPFPINLAPLCTSIGIDPPLSIPAPSQQHPFFQIILFNDQNIVSILQALGQDAQLNRFTLLTRMPVRIKTILDALPAHEIHLGWPKDHTSFVFRGLENTAFELTTHILRHQRLHPWTNNGTFDITDV